MKTTTLETDPPRIRVDEFFKAATGYAQGPFHYQRCLAGGDTGGACQSRLINIPTGLGKTAAIVLAWLWNRLQSQNGEGKMENGKGTWPRRLVYCLPMRTRVPCHL
jgi:CRISPR-associated endonuclease/helicase Cas3